MKQPLTLQEAKDKIAKEMKFKDWLEVRQHHSVGGMEVTMAEAAELYKSSHVEALEEDSKIKNETIAAQRDTINKISVEYAALKAEVEALRKEREELKDGIRELLPRAEKSWQGIDDKLSDHINKLLQP